jgi:hypothetical protein
LHVVRARDAVAGDRALPARCRESGFVPAWGRPLTGRAARVTNIHLHPRLFSWQALEIARGLGCALVVERGRLRLARLPDAAPR